MTPKLPFRIPFLGGLTALLLGSSCYFIPSHGRFFDEAAQAEATYANIFPEQTNGRDFYTLQCWDVPSGNEEKKFNPSELIMADSAYQQMPFHDVVFQDLYGVPCRFSAFAKKEGEILKNAYRGILPYVSSGSLPPVITCADEPRMNEISTTLSAHGYSASPFNDSAKNSCAFFYQETK